MNISRFTMTVLFVVGYVGSYIVGPISAENQSMEADPKPIFYAIAFGLILTLFPRAERISKSDMRPGLFRRYIAANIDVAVAISFLIGFMSLILIMVENSARSEWVWSWEAAVSPFYTPTLILGILGCFIGIYFYFKIHLERGRATPGQYIMGYKIISSGIPNYNRRIWNGLLWFWLWPFAWASRTETQGIYSWDQNSNTQAVRVS